MQRLTQARELHEDMAEVARRHNAQCDGTDQRDAIADIKAQNSAIRGDARADGNPYPELARPDMVLASAAGIGMAAAQSAHLATGYDLAVTTGRDVSIASGRSLFAAVRGAVSLFAYQLGMRLIAATGKVEVQAQSDGMALTALKDVTITSTNGRVVLTAAKEVWIGAGGSYVQINGDGNYQRVAGTDSGKDGFMGRARYRYVRAAFLPFRVRYACRWSHSFALIRPPTIMIISPPFLSAAHQQQNDAMPTAAAGNPVVPAGDVCALNMLECAPGNGAYPVSFNLGWHGGAHLRAPAEGRNPAYVRAIADGKVVYLRKTDTTLKSTLQYLNVRTDDGCVVIRHDTEIGEGNDAKVTYYSVYLHLQTVQPTLSVGRKIYRKDIVGTPGQIYGQYPQIHFEIVCNEANLNNIIGRAPGPVGARGRQDAVYGDLWFFVPRGTKFFVSEPHPSRDDDSAPAIGSLRPQAPVAAAGTSCDIVIRMHYEKDCTLTTYRQDEEGGWSVLDAMLPEVEAEYKLYKRATDLNHRFGENGTTSVGGAATPSPSAIFEMIRFGRCLSDDLAEGQRFNHWRKVRTPDGDGWINLSKAGVRVYSDADFPEWAGWSFINDDPTPDSLCASPTVRRWLDVSHSGHVSHADAVLALGRDAVRQRMAHAVCKFPSEWSRAGLEARYIWLKSPHEALANPLSDTDFNRLMDHARDLAFWEDVQDADFPHANEVWHFPPTAFIRQFRGCGWFSKSEFSRIYPQASAASIDSYLVGINKTLNKYRINGGLRQALFLAQSSVESGQLHYMSELYNGDPFEYFRRYERAKNFIGWLGNVEWNDGGKFRGRGFKQLTGRANYGTYFIYRGWIASSSVGSRWWQDTRWWGFNPPYSASQHANLLPSQNAITVASLIESLMPPVIGDPDIVANDPLVSIDTAGFFWANNRLLPIADSDNVIELTNKVRGDHAQSPTDFPADAHFEQRRSETARIKGILL